MAWRGNFLDHRNKAKSEMRRVKAALLPILELIEKTCWFLRGFPDGEVPFIRHLLV